MNDDVQAFLEFARLGAVERADVAHHDVAQRREFMRLTSDLMFLRFGEPGAPDVSVTDHQVPVEGGSILARVYRPPGSDVLPGHLALHGGGWWLGSVRELVNDAICRDRCVGAGVVVVALDYRLAPEHPFPTGLEDAHAALHWMAENAGALGIDPANLSIGGGSAGGNLCAALSMKVRDEGGPPIVFQLLEVPATDLSMERIGLSFGEAMEVNELRSEDLDEVIGFYVTEPAMVRDPLVSPAWASYLSRLPRTHVMTAERDPLRLQGEEYGRMLADAGVDATVTRVTGAIHASLYLTRVWDVARAWRAEANECLADAHRAVASIPG
jgi:acetyl esterase